MRKANLCAAAEMIAKIQDDMTVLLSGSDGGLQEADHIAEAIQARCLETGNPRSLRWIHARGIGDGVKSGITRFGHEGTVTKLIGGRWTWSRKMRELVRENLIQAYTFPADVIQALVREAGAGRHDLVTHIGTHTLADPQHGGGKCNEKATKDLAAVIQLGGKALFWYKPVKIDVALIHETIGDAQGSIPADMDAYAPAPAAHNCDGIVFAQVREMQQQAIGCKKSCSKNIFLSLKMSVRRSRRNASTPSLAIRGQIP